MHSQFNRQCSNAFFDPSKTYRKLLEGIHSMEVFNVTLAKLLLQLLTLLALSARRFARQGSSETRANMFPRRAECGS